VSDEKKTESPKKKKFSHLAANKSQEETKSKDAKKQLITGKSTSKKTEKNTHAEPDTNNETNNNKDTVANQETQVNSNHQLIKDNQQEMNNENDVELYNDPAMELIQVVASGKKKKKLEDERVRSTYWLLKDERSKINEIARKTGYTKYDVVGLAIRSLYDRIIKAQPEKKTKKPDQQ
jgi:hypothetical protein